MIRKHVHITLEQDRWLKEWLSQYRTNFSEVVRRAIDDYIQKCTPISSSSLSKGVNKNG